MTKRLIALCAFSIMAFTSQAVETTAYKYGNIKAELLADDVRPSVLEREIKKAQMDFYQAFNKVNEIDELDIHCKRRFDYSPNIKHKFCEPAYVSKIRFNNDRQLSAIPEHLRIVNMTRDKNADAGAHLKQLLKDNPELQQKYADVRALTQRYEDVTGKKRKRELNWASIKFWGFRIEP